MIVYVLHSQLVYDLLEVVLGVYDNEKLAEAALIVFKEDLREQGVNFYIEKKIL